MILYTHILKHFALTFFILEIALKMQNLKAEKEIIKDQELLHDFD